jgi:hypothetical protein
MRRDDDLVGVEAVEDVLDRLERIRVADTSAGIDTCRLEPVEAAREALLGRREGGVLVGGPVANARVERGCDDEDLASFRNRPGAYGPVQNRSLDRLVRDDEDPAARWVGVGLHLDSFRGFDATRRPAGPKTLMSGAYEVPKS